MAQKDLERKGEPWRWGRPLEVDKDNWEPSLKLDPLQLHKKLPKKSPSTILQSFGTWSKLEKWTSDKWVTHELTINQKKKKIIVLKCLCLLFQTTMNHFLIRLWYAMKSGFYTTTGVDQLSDWTKKNLQNTSQSEICTNKRSSSLFGGLLPVWSTTAFWIPVELLHLRCLLSKSKRCTENCKAHTWYWSTERAQFICMTTPNACLQLLLKLNKLGYIWSFASTARTHLTSHQPTNASSTISTRFCRENASTTSRRQKMLSKGFPNPEAWIFTLQE